MPRNRPGHRRADAAVRRVEEQHQDQHHRHQQPEDVEQADDPPGEVGGAGWTGGGLGIDFGGIGGSFSPRGRGFNAAGWRHARQRQPHGCRNAEFLQYCNHANRHHHHQPRRHHAAGRLRRALGLRADDQLIAEVTPEGLLLRPAVTLPVEVYDAARARVRRGGGRACRELARRSARRAGRSQPASVPAPLALSRAVIVRVFLDANILFSAAKSDGAMRSLLRRLQ